MRRSLAWLPLSVAIACTRPESPEPPPANEPSAPPPPAVIVEVESTEREVDKTTCAHLSRLETGQADEQAVTACVAELGQLRRERGTDAYVAARSCLLTATDIEAAKRCEFVTRPKKDIRARELCQHVLAIMKQEMGEAYEVSAEELESFADKCVKDLAKERDKLGPDAFDRMASCVLAANGLETMVGCEPESDHETSSP